MSMRSTLTRFSRAAALVGTLLPCAAVHTAPLPEVVDRVIDAHPDIRSAQALLNAADALVGQARSAYYPTLGLNWNAADSRDEQLGAPLDRTIRRSEAVLSWNLFRGAADVQRNRSARYERAAASADLAWTREQVALEVAERYTEVLRLRRVLAHSAGLMDDYRQLYDKVRTRAEAGRLSSADVEQIRVDLIQVESRHADLQSQLDAAEYRFARITGQPPEALSAPGFAPAEWSRDTLLAAAEQFSPRLKAARERVKARQADVGVARGRLMPSVDLELRKRLSARIEPAQVSDTVDATQLSVALEIPLGGGDFSRIREALERRDAALASADAARLAIDTELAPLVREREQLLHIQPRLRERVDASRRLVDAYTLQFDAARRSLSDLASAHADRFSARTEVLDNSVRIFAIEARLLSLTGALRERLAHAYRPATLPQESSPVAAADHTPQATAAEQANENPAPGFDAAEQVGAWARDWSAGSYPDYRRHYSADFTTSDHPSTAAWERERRQRVSRTGIAVSIRALTTATLPDGRVMTRFVQHYRAPAYEDTVAKVLLWSRHDTGWQIVRETVE